MINRITSKIKNMKIKEKLNKEYIKKEGKKVVPWLKKASKNYAKTNVLFLTFMITSIINEWLLRSLTVKNMFAVKPLLADLAILLIIGALGYFIKPKNQYKYFFGWSIFFTILCLVNSMYYTN